MFRLFIFALLFHPITTEMYPVSAKAKLIRNLTEISSGSGIEIIDNLLYISGDDSPTLFILDEKEYAIKKRIQLFPYPDNSRIPKPVKPDFEAMTLWNTGNESKLLILGSGGIEKYRENLVIIDLKKETDAKLISLAPFYAEIIASKKLQRNQLNIEAAAIWHDYLYLFNRGVNFIVKVKTEDLIENLHTKKCPSYTVYDCDLPSYNNNITGFSGATIIDDEGNILLTATSDSTTDFIADGEITGSYVFTIKASEINDNMKFELIPITDHQGNILKEKIESVAIKSIDKNKIVAYAVADNDNGTTGLFLTEVQINK